MNRRDFLKALGLASGAAAAARIAPSVIAGYVPGLVCTSDNPWLQHRIVEEGYSKLRITVIQKILPLYSVFRGPYVPVDFVVSDRQMRVEFDVPPSTLAQYQIGEFLPATVWPYISNLWPIQVDLEMGDMRHRATVKAELLDPGDGIDLSMVESVLRRS